MSDDLDRVTDDDLPTLISEIRELRQRVAQLERLAEAVRARKRAHHMPGFTTHDRARRDEAVVTAIAREDAALVALDQAK